MKIIKPLLLTLTVAVAFVLVGAPEARAEARLKRSTTASRVVIRAKAAKPPRARRAKLPREWVWKRYAKKLDATMFRKKR